MGKSRKVIELKLSFSPYNNEIDKKIWDILKQVGRTQETKSAFIKGVLFALMAINQGTQNLEKPYRKREEQEKESDIQELSLEEATKILGPLGEL